MRTYNVTAERHAAQAQLNRAAGAPVVGPERNLLVAWRDAARRVVLDCGYARHTAPPRHEVAA